LSGHPEKYVPEQASGMCDMKGRDTKLRKDASDIHTLAGGVEPVAGGPVDLALGQAVEQQCLLNHRVQSDDQDWSILHVRFLPDAGIVRATGRCVTKVVRCTLTVKWW
jgi:hypothetical protein